MQDELVDELSLPARAESIGPLRQALIRFSRDLRMDPERFADIELAASEALGNAIRHGTSAGEDRVSVRLSADAELLVVALEYRGEPFVVERPCLPISDQTNGRGRYLMESLADSVEYRFGAGLTQVVLRKRLAG